MSSTVVDNFAVGDWVYDTNEFEYAVILDIDEESQIATLGYRDILGTSRRSLSYLEGVAVIRNPKPWTWETAPAVVKAYNIKHPTQHATLIAGLSGFFSPDHGILLYEEVAKYYRTQSNEPCGYFEDDY